MAEKAQIISVWCPNCGVPRTAKVRIKAYLAKASKVRYYCSACGFRADIIKPVKLKAKEKDDNVPSMKDLAKMGKVFKTLSSVVK